MVNSPTSHNLHVRMRPLNSECWENPPQVALGADEVATRGHPCLDGLHPVCQKDRWSKMSAEQVLKLRGYQGQPSWMVSCSPQERPVWSASLAPDMPVFIKKISPLLTAPPGAWVERPHCCVVKVERRLQRRPFINKYYIYRRPALCKAALVHGSPLSLPTISLTSLRPHWAFSQSVFSRQQQGGTAQTQRLSTGS